MNHNQQLALSKLLDGFNKHTQEALAEEGAVKRRQEEERDRQESILRENVEPAFDSFTAELKLRGFDARKRNERGTLELTILPPPSPQSVYRGSRDDPQRCPIIRLSSKGDGLEVWMQKVSRRGGSSSGIRGTVPYAEVTPEKVADYLVELLQHFVDS